MFLVKFFGIMDFLAAIILVLSLFGIVPFRFVLLFAAYLFIKGFIFKGDVASTIDMIAAVLMLLMYFIGSSSGFFTVLAVIIIVYLAQKAFFSFVSI
jgi:hypothetical protein